MEIAEIRLERGVDATTYTKRFSGGTYIGSAELGDEAYLWSGLYIELKKEGTHLKKKNGDWATEHIAEQAKVLEDLRSRGYCAEFAVGFEEAKKIIDEYLGSRA